MPSYRLPQNLGARRVLDEVGMHCTEEDIAPGAFPAVWVMNEDAEHVEAPSTCHTADSVDSVAQPASREDITQDASQYALSYARDFRALYQF